jgi:hypothetical protein
MKNIVAVMLVLFNTVHPVRMGMEPVETVLICDPQKNKQAACKTDGKPDNVQNRDGRMTDNIPYGQ